MKINWIKFKKYYFALSGLMVIVSVFSLVKYGLRLGVDFTGGVVAEYSFANEISTEDLVGKIQSVEIEVSSVQRVGGGNYLLRFGNLDKEQVNKVEGAMGELSEFEQVQFENVGPTIGPELVKKTAYAILISASAILLWVAFQFKDIRFGACAILAMFHDSFILIGSFSLMGYLYNAPVDFLFVTALLTTLSFSVHDTIVVYDRIREIKKKHGGEIHEVANKALSETMRRSINNSVTIILMLLSLALFGGSSIFWFAIALLIGTILGTYSSPFVAVPLLVVSERFKRN